MKPQLQRSTPCPWQTTRSGRGSHHVPWWTVRRSYMSTSRLPSPFLSRLILLCTCRDRSWGLLQRKRQVPWQDDPVHWDLETPPLGSPPPRHPHGQSPWAHQLAGGNLPRSASADGSANTPCRHAPQPSPQLTSSSFVACATLTVSPQALAQAQAAKRQCGAAQAVLPQHTLLGQGIPEAVPHPEALARAQGTGSLKPGSPLLVQFLATCTNRL